MLGESEPQSIRTNLELYVGEVVKVGGVIDGAHLDGDGGGALAHVAPVHSAEERHGLDVLYATLRAQSATQPQLIRIFGVIVGERCNGYYSTIWAVKLATAAMTLTSGF